MKYNEALAYLERAITIYDKTLPADHPNVIKAKKYIKLAKEKTQ